MQGEACPHHPVSRRRRGDWRHLKERRWGRVHVFTVGRLEGRWLSEGENGSDKQIEPRPPKQFLFPISAGESASARFSAPLARRGPCEA